MGKGFVVFKQADISNKLVTYRVATASGRIRLRPSTVARIRRGLVEKGNPLSVSEIAGMMASKRTHELLPLCHPLKIENTKIKIAVIPSGLEVTTTVAASEKTGVEMEALTATSVALLNVWDMVKAYEKDGRGQYPTTRIEKVRVVSKAK